MKKLFLDDIRTVDMVYHASEIPNFEVVRSYDVFVAVAAEQIRGLLNNYLKFLKANKNS